jgi:hypothetical protein
MLSTLLSHSFKDLAILLKRIDRFPESISLNYESKLLSTLGGEELMGDHL